MKRILATAVALFAVQSAALAQNGTAVQRDLPTAIGLTLIWAVVAAILFIIAFKAVDAAVPGDLKQQLADGNTAMAVFVSGICIACAIIIAALVG